jgi:hypothetical protein
MAAARATEYEALRAHAEAALRSDEPERTQALRRLRAELGRFRRRERELPLLGHRSRPCQPHPARASGLANLICDPLELLAGTRVRGQCDQAVT